jgi:hypothetical protein
MAFSCGRITLIGERKMKLKKPVFLGGFALFLGAIPYFVILKLTGNPRVADNSLSMSDMTTPEAVLFGIGFLLSIICWLRCLVVCATRREFKWLISVLLIWPLSAYYVWREE